MLSDYFVAFRNAVVKCDSVSEACRIALEFLIQELHYQAGAIFLMDKHGLVKPEALVGRNFDGRELGDTDPECYQPDKWLFARFFVGDKTVRTSLIPPAPPNLPPFYKAIAGDNPRVLALPIEGASHVYGVLVLFNGPAIVDLVVTYSTLLSTALSVIRARNEVTLISKVTHRLVDLQHDDSSQPLSGLFHALLAPLVENDVIFKALVLRIEDTNGEFVVREKLGDEVDWRKWQDSPIRDDSPHLAGVALKQAHAEIVPHVPARPDLFRSSEWLVVNKIKSAAAFPLLCGPRVIGVLIVYTAFPYDFPERAQDALSHIANAIVMRVVRHLFRPAEAELADHQNRSLIGLLQYEADHRYRCWVHEEAHFLRGLANEIEELADCEGNEIRRRLIEIRAGVHEQQRRVKASLDRPRQEFVDVSDLAKIIVEKYRQGSRRDSIAFDGTDISTTRRIFVEKERIEVLLTCLLDNACDAIRAAGRTDGLVSIRVAESTLYGERLEICIQDNGSGIPPEDLPRVYRGLRFTTRKEGTGLGLSIVRGIAETFGGKMTFDPVLNCGTRVTVWFDFSKIPWRSDDESQ